MGKWIIAGLAVLLAGCATSPIPAEQADPVPTERLYSFLDRPPGLSGAVIVTRDAGLTGSACATSVNVDGEKGADLHQGETVTLYLSAGEHILSASTGFGICPNIVKEREITVKDGESKRYRISIDNTGTIDLSRTAL